MAISEETQAILDRLQAEGRLTRNSGTNSIRSVKVQLDRFEGVFNSISANIADQTNLLRKSMGIQEEALEAQKRREDFDELNPPQPATDPTPTTSDSTPEREKSKGIFDLIAGAGASLLGAMKPLLLGGAGLFVAYNFAKGYIDEKTGGGFTKFENSMIETFNSVDWTALGQSFMTFAGKVPEAITSIVNFLSDPLNAILAGAGLTAAGILAGFGGGALARGVTRGIIDGVLGQGGDMGERRGRRGGGGGRGLMNLRNVARAGALGIFTGALSYYGDDVKSWLTSVGVPGDWSNVAVDTLTAVGTGASLGWMFGPTGALVGAAAGLAYSFGKGIYNWFKGAAEDGEEKLQKRLELANVIDDNMSSLQNYDDAILRMQRSGNTRGVLGTAGAGAGVTMTDAEQLATAGNLYGDDFDKALEKAASDNATPADIAEVQDMLDQATIEFMKGRYQGILANRGQLRMLGENLGETSDDALYKEMEAQMDELLEFITLTNGQDQNFIDLYRMYRNEMMASFTDRFDLGEYDEIKGDLTPEQRRIFEKLRTLMDPSNEIMGPMSKLSTPAANQALADAAAGGGSSVVIGKIGGDTYATTQNTKMGDQNVANVTQFGAQGNPMSTLAVVG